MNQVANNTMSQETSPLKKRRVDKQRAVIFKSSDSISAHIKFGSLSKNKMVSFIPVSTTDGKPVLIQISGGGTVPKMFGVEEAKEQSNKLNITFNIANNDDHANLQSIRDEFATLCAKQWDIWFPSGKKPADDTLKSMCNNLVSEKKKKTNMDGYWPGNMKTSINVTDITTAQCRIVDKDTSENIPLEELPGMKWTRAIVELRHVYIQSSKTYGITKRLRYLECFDDNIVEEIVPID